MKLLKYIAFIVILFSSQAIAHRPYYYRPYWHRPVIRQYYQPPVVIYRSDFMYHYRFEDFHVESEVPLTDVSTLSLYDIYRNSAEEFYGLYHKRTGQYCESCHGKEIFLYIYDEQIVPGWNAQGLYVNYGSMYTEFAYNYGRYLSSVCNVAGGDYEYYAGSLRNTEMSHRR